MDATITSTPLATAPPAVTSDAQQTSIWHLRPMTFSSRITVPSHHNKGACTAPRQHEGLTYQDSEQIQPDASASTPATAGKRGHARAGASTDP